MKVGTRITAATALVVILTLGVYAVIDLRSAAQRRRSNLENEARTLALSLRASLELDQLSSTFAHPEDVARALNSPGAGWHVEILPRRLLDEGARTTPGQRKRLRTLAILGELHLTAEEGDRLVYAVPLRAPATSPDADFDVAGALEVSRDVSFLSEAFHDDLARTLPLLGLAFGLTVLALAIFTRNLMTRPVAKLLSGIDDVAKGDLSHVLLSQGDDEIGALATRFNDMTFSLRESRAETERQNRAKLALEQRLSHTEKLATIGQLAAEIAHEVGTPLNVIAGRARATQRKADDRDAVEKNAVIIAEQTSRITRIIQRLLDFTRRKVGSAGPARVNLNEVTLTTMELLVGQFANARIRTTLARGESLPHVSGDADRLQQVLLNLLLNAIQAMPEGGALRVETSAVTRQRPGLEMAPEQTFVCVEVSDTGVGIPREMRDKIFEPFYTSREGTGGTGLGLAVCSGIVKEHDGWIEVDDAAGGGTIFRIFLPEEGDARRATVTLP